MTLLRFTEIEDVHPTPVVDARLIAAAGGFNAVDTLSKFGFNATVGTGEETIWDGDGLVAYPAAAGPLKISSTDAKDTAAGVGARTLEVYGCDGEFSEHNEIVTLNGQTPVLPANNYLRQWRGIVRTAGSELDNAGTIWFGTGDVTNGVPATKYMAISPGQNQTLHASWTVPAGKTFYLMQLLASTAGNQNQSATVRFVVRPVGEVWQTKEKFLISPGGGVARYPYEIPVPFAAGTDLEMRATGSATVDVSAKFEGYVIG